MSERLTDEQIEAIRQWADSARELSILALCEEVQETRRVSIVTSPQTPEAKRTKP